MNRECPRWKDDGPAEASSSSGARHPGEPNDGRRLLLLVLDELVELGSLSYNVLGREWLYAAFV